VMVGTAVAASQATIQWPVAAGCLGGCILIQLGCNFANDYFDFRKGADTADRVGPARAVQKGWISPRRMLAATCLVLTIALALGLWLIAIGGLPIAIIGGASLVCAIAYTGGPYPLAYVGLGDVFVLLFFGFAAVVGTVWVLILSAPPAAWVAGASVGFIATAILVVNNLRDRDTDAIANKRTLAVRLGATAARWEYTLLVLAAPIAVLAAYASGVVGTGWLLCLLTSPLIVQQIHAIWTVDGAALNPHLGKTARLELIFALLLSIGISL
jgi:1,4-dihydroxy-2-naphthoate octaprenyltransferase